MTYGEWLDRLSTLTDVKFPRNGTFILQSYFRRGFSPERAAAAYVPIVEKSHAIHGV